MGIAVTVPRGGLIEDISGARLPMVLRNAEIERFEDHHCPIFQAWDGFYGRGPKPSCSQVRDIVALGLVGAGMKDVEADNLISSLGPDWNLNLFKIAQALLGAAFLPDTVEGGGDEDDFEVSDEKKTDPAPGQSDE